MSTFRGGNAAQIPAIGPQGQNSPAIYNAIGGHPHNQPHTQHSPIVQNEALVGKALPTVRFFIISLKMPYLNFKYLSF